LVLASQEMINFGSKSAAYKLPEIVFVFTNLLNEKQLILLLHNVSLFGGSAEKYIFYFCFECN